MIKSIRHKGLLQLWTTGKSPKLPKDQLRRIIDILQVLDKAKAVPKDFEFFKSWGIHPLKGELKGYWALTVKENWRVIFRFDGQDVQDVNYIDYH